MSTKDNLIILSRNFNEYEKQGLLRLHAMNSKKINDKRKKGEDSGGLGGRLGMDFSDTTTRMVLDCFTLKN